jgi:hypothetical protein
LNLNASTLTDAFIAIAESICTNFTFPDDNVIRELCFSAKIMGPSPSQITLPNGTEYIEYIGVSSESYFFENELKGLTTVVTWEGETEDCVATANGEDSLTCTLCANGSVSAQIAPTWNTEGRLSAVTIPFCTLMVSRFYPFFPFLSTFEYKADKNGTLPAAAGEAPTTAEAAPSVGSASVAAYIQKGWLATVGTVMMLAVGLVLVLF